MFYSTAPHYCTVCPPVLNKKGNRIDQQLFLLISNYSGCGVDVVKCPNCDKTFQISYKVDEIIEIEFEPV